MNTKLSLFLVLLILVSCTSRKSEEKEKSTPSPRIVNIINFIRDVEPRIEAITGDVLYETVVQQVNQLREYELPATFLLQYDALINPRYQELLKKELYPGSEIGGWWEITQPHVEAAGYTWRGRYSWDWHADVGFATGYSPEERVKLVDVYMEKFKEVFGQYPTSIGSWFIDAVTLAYLSDKYHIVASCNCKDQVGTDGYTLWGGYWNQAYYPSRQNAYMPAQTVSGQIPVPIFRMLGSDPIYQYDNGLGDGVQGVESLEPVYKRGGGNRNWVEWFFKSNFEEPCLAFAYAQAGQENSFTWEKMKDGLNIQIPILSALAKEKKIRVETLSESGAWFKTNYSVTPPTAVTALTDHQNKDKKTVWYNSRYYRVNLLWEGPSFRFRDIHLFNENMVSDYLAKAGTTTDCVYSTLPLVDGFLWSTAENLAGLRLMAQDKNGTIAEVKGGLPVVTEMEDGILMVVWPLERDLGDMILLFFEDRMEVTCQFPKGISWFFELRTSPDADLPFTGFADKSISATHRGFNYLVTSVNGNFVDGKANSSSDFTFRIMPEKNKVVLKLMQ
jgi:hypothetical protein